MKSSRICIKSSRQNSKKLLEDQEEFTRRYKRYNPQLRRTIKEYGVELPDLDDLAQDIWLLTWEYRKQLKTLAFQKWLEAIAYRRFLYYKEHDPKNYEVSYGEAEIEELIY